MICSRSQWPRGLKRKFTASRLLRMWVRIPPGALIFVCCECCVLSSRGLYHERITRPEESYRLWCVVVCVLETSWMRRPWPTGGCCAKSKKQTKWDLYLITYRLTSLFYPIQNFYITASDFGFRAFFLNMLAKYFIGFIIILYLCPFRGHEVWHLVEALRYKSEKSGLNSRLCHGNFSLTQSFRLHWGPGVASAS